MPSFSLAERLAVEGQLLFASSNGLTTVFEYTTAFYNVVPPSSQQRVWCTSLQAAQRIRNRPDVAR
ncbi:hypothetical protein GCM10025784_05760 [Citricoccus nitrophenolicus]